MPLANMSNKLKNMMFEEDSIIIHDPNLIQGRKFISFEKKYRYTGLPHLKLLEETSDPKLDSIVEALGEDNSTNNQYNISLNKLSTHEAEFNKTLSAYTVLYQQYNQAVVQQIHRKKTFEKYFDKIVEYNGEFYYVNNFGYTHKFTTKLWTSWNNANKGQFCDGLNTEPMQAGNDFKHLPAGPPMNGKGNKSTNVTQPCKVAGKIIQKKGANPPLYAWVSPDGTKHIFTDNIWNGRSATCKTKAIEIEIDAFNALPNGPPMSASMPCNRFQGTAEIWDRLGGLNARLVTLTETLYQDISTMSKYDNIYKDKLNKKTNTLDNYKKSFAKDKKELDTMTFNNDVLEGELDDSKNVLRMNKIRYMLWVALLFVMIIILSFSYKNNASNLALTVILIVVIILVYYGVKFVMKKLNL
jgi:hypothetical protein